MPDPMLFVTDLLMSLIFAITSAGAFKYDRHMAGAALAWLSALFFAFAFVIVALMIIGGSR